MKGHPELRPAVFVCGPITTVLQNGTFNASVREAIERIARQIEAEGFVVLSAHREEGYGDRIPTCPGTVFRRDWHMARFASAMVFVLPLDGKGELIRTDGTFMELGWAVALRKPVFIVTPARGTGRSYLFDGLLEVAPDVHWFDLDDTDAEDRLLAELRRLHPARDRRRTSARSVAFCCKPDAIGPLSTVAALAEGLRRRRPEYRLVFVGSESLAPYAEACNGFDDVVSVKPRDSPEAVVALVSDYDAVIDCLDFGVLSRWRGTMPPLFFLDSLALMRRSLHSGASSARIYFVQDCLPPPTPLPLPPNAVVVPPILPPGIEAPRRDWEAESDRLLVNFPARQCAEPGSQLEQLYLRKMLGGLFAALKEIDRLGSPVIRNVLVCGNNGLLDTKLEIEWSELSLAVELAKLSPERFLAEMRRAGLLLTQPGLATILEASALGVPCRLLLPQSYEQFRIASSCVRLGFPQWPLPEVASSPGTSEVSTADGPPTREVYSALERHLECSVDEIAETFLHLISMESTCTEFERLGRAAFLGDGGSQVVEHVLRQIEGCEVREEGRLWGHG